MNYLLYYFFGDSMNFLKKIKEISKIKEILKKFKTLENDNYFDLLQTNYVKLLIKKTTDKSINEGKSFYIQNLFNIIENWNSIRPIPIEIGSWLESLIENNDSYIGIHKTGGCGKIDIHDNVFLNNIFTHGLYITGDLSSGVISRQKYIQLTKNITPMFNILDLIIYIKSSYKNSTGSIIISIPNNYVDSNYRVIPGYEEKVYTYIDGQLTLKPEFIVGFITHDNNFCELILRKDFLKLNKNR